MINIFTGLGTGWAKVVPAALLVGALLVILSFAIIRNNNPVAAASLVEQSVLSDYSQPVHVQFNKSVLSAEAISNTKVEEVLGANDTQEVATNNTYAPNGNNKGMLTIAPDGAWVPGATYNIVVDSANIHLDSPVDDSALGSSPIIMSFSTPAHTPTPTNTATDTPIPTNTPTSTNTPVPPTTTVQPQTTAIAQGTAGGTTVAVNPGVTNVPALPSVTAKPSDTARPSATPVKPTNTVPAATNTAVVPTNTSVPPTVGPTQHPSNTVEPSKTPLASHTPGPDPTDTPTSTARPSGTPGGATPSATATIRKGSPTATVTGTVQPRVTATPGKGTPTATPTQACLIMPVRGFGQVWSANQDVRDRIGCPTMSEGAVTPAAQQHFENGYMFWRGDVKKIYVFVGSASGQFGTWYEFDDTWNDGDPVPTVAALGTPPAGKFVPVRGFGKLWANNEALRLQLGWATDLEVSTDAVWQPYENGYALWTADNNIFFMYADGTWQRFVDTYKDVQTTDPPSTPAQGTISDATPTEAVLEQSGQ